MVGPGRRRDLLTLFVLTIGSLFAEMVTVGAVLPLLLLATDQAVANHGLAARLIWRLGAGYGQQELFVGAAMLFAGAALSAALLRLLVLRFSGRVAFGIGHEVSTAIFSRTLNQPYSYYVGRNPSEVFAGLDKIQALIFAVVLPMIQGLVAVTIVLAILAVLLAIAPGITLIAAGVVAAIYGTITLFIGSSLRANSRVISAMSTARMKALQEGHGGLRDILLEQAQEVFEEKYRHLDAAYRRAQSRNLFVTSAPRIIVEGCGVLLIAAVVLYVNGRPGGIVAAIPALGAVAIAAQRLLPLLNSAYLSWSQLSGNRDILRDVLALLRTPVLARQGKAAPLPFATDIVFDDVDLHYPDRPPALTQISLRIEAGARLAIIGPTGSGKSSLLDLLMGIVEPTRGEIRVDGIRLDDALRNHWQATLAHVPQSIYLADASIAANIAFGHAEADIDLARVRSAAERSRLADFVQALPQGYDTRVGDRGVRLSGGQRQRIGIARALYKQARVLVLDEPTGQLDAETEREILTTIAGLDDRLTIILVTHQATALAGMNRIARLEGGRLAGSSEPGTGEGS